MDADGRVQEAVQECNGMADVALNEEAMATDDVLQDASGGPVPPPPVAPPLKRARSPGSLSTNPIDLTSEQQVCIDGKMCELVDLSQDQV